MSDGLELISNASNQERITRLIDDLQIFIADLKVNPLHTPEDFRSCIDKVSEVLRKILSVCKEMQQIDVQMHKEFREKLDMYIAGTIEQLWGSPLLGYRNQTLFDSTYH